MGECGRETAKGRRIYTADNDIKERDRFLPKMFSLPNRRYGRVGICKTFDQDRKGHNKQVDQASTAESFTDVSGFG